eukprot:GHVS01024172.1.p1 GENE.GHVS01024172.1~~GHVS01024172.1.p1  ORF type:complete len:193 (-),score=10.70 GHVS01024172.1:72-650(-)
MTAQTRVWVEHECFHILLCRTGTRSDDTSSVHCTAAGTHSFLQELVQGEVSEESLKAVLSMQLQSNSNQVGEDNISGLDNVKKIIRDKVINPILRPDLHRGLFEPPKGILLFGPPGTGKTLLAKWISKESNARFFDASPSSLCRKWFGETETIIKTLFKVAEFDSPSIIFMDEVDSLLSKRADVSHVADKHR